jgi:hypothetical protein
VSFVDDLAKTLVLGSCLDLLRESVGAFDLVDHWKQGEFHHDVVVRLPERALGSLPGRVLVIATNCNGGVKEVLCFPEVPDRVALWALRCPGNPEFPAEPAVPLARSITIHWFDPCELLTSEARSELLPEHRERQAGGGWVPVCTGARKRQRTQ